ncbi:hypothetical protein [Saccharopolyspora hattusasensis]|uniref:hypothetical protein n=1 Tax=Saccharopolyspora hattusasensis TaxID=1128679 RepID=UPI003D974810
MTIQPIPSVPRVGLYSIGVRGLSVPELLRWAQAEGIPFVHLRAGPRGYDAARQDDATLSRWARTAEQTIPISGLTADVDLADVLHAAPAAMDEIAALARVARFLRARWVRVLARTPLVDWPDRSPALAEPDGEVVPLLIELHHPGWLHGEPLAALESLLARSPHVRLLVDTAQVHQALTEQDTGLVGPVLARIMHHAAVLHLSDDGHGLDGIGHRLAAGHAAKHITSGHPLEVAFEWTGACRTPTTCLSRFRSAVTWWTRTLVSPEESL